LRTGPLVGDVGHVDVGRNLQHLSERPSVTTVIGLIRRRGRGLMPSAQLFHDLLLKPVAAVQRRRCGNAGPMLRRLPSLPSRGGTDKSWEWFWFEASPARSL
jgi:hypothetical protein